MWAFVDVKLVVQKKQSTDVHVVCGIPAGIYVISTLLSLPVPFLSQKVKVPSLCPFSLPCVKKHKAELTCNGVRDKTAYVSIQQFTEMNLLSGKPSYV